MSEHKDQIHPNTFSQNPEYLVTFANTRKAMEMKLLYTMAALIAVNVFEVCKMSTRGAYFFQSQIRWLI